MTAIFEEKGFKFEPPEAVPEHEERNPDAESRDRNLRWIEGYDASSDEYFTIATGVKDFDMAALLLAAWQRHRDAFQPGSTQEAYIRFPKPKP